MPFSSHNDALDALLDEYATANLLTVCSDFPTTRTEAVTTFALLDVTLTPGDGNGDFVVADGDVSGRKLTVAEQANVTIDATGDGNHLALCDGTRLLYVTECSLPNLVATNTQTVPAFDIEVRDPAS